MQECGIVTALFYGLKGIKKNNQRLELLMNLYKTMYIIIVCFFMDFKGIIVFFPTFICS